MPPYKNNPYKVNESGSQQEKGSTLEMDKSKGLKEKELLTKMWGCRAATRDSDIIRKDKWRECYQSLKGELCRVGFPLWRDTFSSR